MKEGPLPVTIKIVTHLIFALEEGATITSLRLCAISVFNLDSRQVQLHTAD